MRRLRQLHQPIGLYRVLNRKPTKQLGLVAALTGARRATLGFGPGHTPDLLALATDRVAKHYVAHGLRRQARGGLFEGVYIDTCPPALQSPRFPRPVHLQALRAEPYVPSRDDWAMPDFADRQD